MLTTRENPCENVHSVFHVHSPVAPADIDAPQYVVLNKCMILRSCLLVLLAYLNVLDVNLVQRTEVIAV